MGLVTRALLSAFGATIAPATISVASSVAGITDASSVAGIPVAASVAGSVAGVSATGSVAGISIAGSVAGRSLTSSVAGISVASTIARTSAAIFVAGISVACGLGIVARSSAVGIAVPAPSRAKRLPVVEIQSDRSHVIMCAIANSPICLNLFHVGRRIFPDVRRRAVMSPRNPQRDEGENHD